MKAKELVIISGKGGTGKTSIAASFAYLAQKAVIADCDVDAPNLHLVLSPEALSTENYYGNKKAFIDPGLCTGCGHCVLACRFNAIGDFFVVDPLSCEGCGVCAKFCPNDAIEMREHIAGQCLISETTFGPMVHAKLGIGAENSGKLVTQIKKNAQEISNEKQLPLIIVDGPPGVGCPVIASLTGASFILLVTEPTVSGYHDLTRAFELAKRFRTKVGICVNKSDINRDIAGKIAAFAAETHASLHHEIPYDDDVIAAIVEGKPLVSFSKGIAAQSINEMWRKIALEIELYE